MAVFIALLRAVNVGGTGKLPMADFRKLCEDAGFKSVRTYIASGNVVFASGASEAEVKATIEKALLDYAGKRIDVLLRSATELAAVLVQNPFQKAEPNRVLAIFLNEPPPLDALDHLKGQQDEELKLGEREIYVHYGSRMGTSKLKIPAATEGTARNMNTIAKLVAMARDGEKDR